MADETIIRAFDAQFNFEVSSNAALAALDEIEGKYDVLSTYLDHTPLEIDLQLRPNTQFDLLDEAKKVVGYVEQTLPKIAVDLVLGQVNVERLVMAGRNMADQLQSVLDQSQAIQTISDTLRDYRNALGNATRKLEEFGLTGKRAGKEVDAQAERLKAFTLGLQSTIDTYTRAITESGKFPGESKFVAALADQVKAARSSMIDLGKSGEEAMAIVRQTMQSALGEDALQVIKSSQRKANVPFEDWRDKVLEAIGQVIVGFEDMDKELVSESIIPDMVTKINEWFAKIPPAVQVSTQAAVDEFKRAAGEMETAATDPTKDIKKAWGDMWIALKSMGVEAIKAGIAGPYAAGQKPVTDIAAILGVQAGDIRKAMLASSSPMPKVKGQYVAEIDDVVTALARYQTALAQTKLVDEQAAAAKKKYEQVLREQVKAQKDVAEQLRAAFAVGAGGMGGAERIKTGGAIDTFNEALQRWQSLKAQMDTGHQATLGTVADMAAAAQEALKLGRGLETALDTKLFYSAKEAAEALGISVARMGKILAGGEAAGLQGTGGRWFMQADELERLRIKFADLITVQDAATASGRSAKEITEALTQAKVQLTSANGREYITLGQATAALSAYKTETQLAEEEVRKTRERIDELGDALHFQRQRMAEKTEPILGRFLDADQMAQVTNNVTVGLDRINRLRVGLGLFAGSLSQPGDALRALGYAVGGVDAQANSFIGTVSRLATWMQKAGEPTDNWQKSMRLLSVQLQDTALASEDMASVINSQFKGMAGTTDDTIQNFDRVMYQLRRVFHDFRGFATELQNEGFSEGWRKKYVLDIQIAEQQLAELALVENDKGERVIDVNENAANSFAKMSQQLERQKNLVALVTNANRLHEESVVESTAATRRGGEEYERQSGRLGGFIRGIRDLALAFAGLRLGSQKAAEGVAANDTTWTKAGKGLKQYSDASMLAMGAVTILGPALGQLSPQMGAAANAATQMASTVQQAFERMQRSSSTGMIAIQQFIGGISMQLGMMATNAAASWAKMAADVQTKSITLRAVAENVGISMGEVDKAIKKLQQTGITTAEAIASTTQFLRAGLPIDKIEELARAAQNLAVSMGINSSEAFAQFIKFVQTGNSQLLDFVGININATQMMDKYAKTAGTVTKALNPYQQQLARITGLTDEAAKLTGVYEDAMTTTGKQLSSMARYVEELQVAIGQRLLPVLEVAVKFFNDAVNALQQMPPAIMDVVVALGMMAAAVGVLGGIAVLVSPQVAVIIAVLAALAGAAVLAFKAVQDNAYGLGTKFKELGDIFNEWLIPVMENVGFWVGKIGEQLALMQETIGNLLGAMQGFGDAARDTGSQFAELMTILDAVSDIINGLLEAVWYVLKGINAALRGGNPWPWFEKAAQDVMLSVITVFTDIIGTAFDWGWSLIVNLANGIMSAANSVLSGALTAVGNAIGNFLAPGSPPKEGPLRGIMDWGSALINTFARGFATADFGMLNSLLAPAAQAIQAALTGGGLTKESATGLIGSVRTALAELISVYRKTGAVSESVMGKIAQQLGTGSEEYMKYIRLQMEYLQAEDKVAAIEKQIAESASKKGYVPRALQKQLDAAKKEAEEKKSAMEWQKEYLALQADLADEQKDASKDLGKAADKMKDAAEKLGESISGFKYPSGGDFSFNMPEFKAPQMSERWTQLLETFQGFLSSSLIDNARSFGEWLDKLTGVAVSPWIVRLADAITRIATAVGKFVTTELPKFFRDLATEIGKLDFQAAVNAFAIAMGNIAYTLDKLFGKMGSGLDFYNWIKNLAAFGWGILSTAILGVVGSLDDMATVVANIMKGATSLAKLFISWITGDKTGMEQAKSDAGAAVVGIAEAILKALTDQGERIAKSFGGFWEEIEDPDRPGRTKRVFHKGLIDVEAIKKGIQTSLEAIRKWIEVKGQEILGPTFKFEPKIEINFQPPDEKSFNADLEIWKRGAEQWGGVLGGVVVEAIKGALVLVAIGAMFSPAVILAPLWNGLLMAVGKFDWVKLFELLFAGIPAAINQAWGGITGNKAMQESATKLLAELKPQMDKLLADAFNNFIIGATDVIGKIPIIGKPMEDLFRAIFTAENVTNAINLFAVFGGGGSLEDKLKWSTKIGTAINSWLGPVIDKGVSDAIINLALTFGTDTKTIVRFRDILGNTLGLFLTAVLSGPLVLLRDDLWAPIVENILSGLERAFGVGVGGAATGGVEKAEAEFNKGTGGGGSRFEKIGEALGAALAEGIKKGVNYGWILFLDWVDRNFFGVVTLIKKIFNIKSPSLVMAEIGTALVDGLRKGIEDVWASKDGFLPFIVAKAQEIVTSIKTALGWDETKGTFENMVSIGEAIVKGLQKGINDFWTDFQNDLLGKIGTIVAWIRRLLLIGSPSEVFAGIGRNMIAGMEKGLDFSGVQSAMAGGVGDLLKTANLGQIALAAQYVMPTPAQPVGPSTVSNSYQYQNQFAVGSVRSDSDIQRIANLVVEQLQRQVGRAGATGTVFGAG